MRGYTGREAPPKERLTVGEGQKLLVTAINEMKVATAVGAALGVKFLRQPVGVNFVTLELDKDGRPTGRITRLVEIGSLPTVELSKLIESGLPASYPALPFANIPAGLRSMPRRLVIQFKDVVAHTTISQELAVEQYRVGTIQLEEGHDETAILFDIPSASFKPINLEK